MTATFSRFAVLAICLSTPLAAATAPTALMLADGTPIHLRIVHGLSFSALKLDDLIELEVAEDVRVNGVLVLARGTRAMANLTVAEAKSRWGRGGKLGLNLDAIKLLNGVSAPVRATKLAAPPLLFAFGKDESFPEGAPVEVCILGDLKLDPATFLEDVLFTSNPPGALVTMYGAPVGRTPFTTRLAPGTYKAVFSADGLTDLTESLRIGPGYSTTVNAAFESKP